MSGLLPDGCYTVADAIEWSIRRCGEMARELRASDDWTIAMFQTLELRQQKMMWGYIIHMKLLYFRKRDEAARMTTRAVRAEKERDALAGALREIAAILKDWNKQLPQAEEFYSACFAIGLARGIAEKALGIPLNEEAKPE